jgi:hypothetical protein
LRSSDKVIKNHFTILYVLMAAAVVAFLIKPWEWGMMDDTNFYLRLRGSISECGPVKGVFCNFMQLFRDDAGWGLFRPSWWAYASLIYLTSPKIAYTIRVLMLFFTVIAPLIYLVRATKTKPDRYFLFFATLALLANRAMYEGISYISLQELSGCFFVALGIYWGWARTWRGNEVFTLACFFVAAFFKAPFVWLIIFYSLYLATVKKSRVTAIVSLILSFAFLFIVSNWAKNGTYTSRFNPLLLENWLRSLREFWRPAAYVAAIFALFLFTWRKSFALNMGKFTAADYHGLILFCGGTLYFLNLLPWGAGGYYFMSPVYLWTTGALFILGPRFSDTKNRYTSAKILTLSLISIVCFLAAGKGFMMIFWRDAGLRQTRDWALSLPRQGLVIGCSAEEPTARFDQLMRMRTDFKWENKMVHVPEGVDPQERLDFYMVFREGPFNQKLAGEELHDFGRITIHRPNNPN